MANRPLLPRGAAPVRGLGRESIGGITWNWRAGTTVVVAGFSLVGRLFDEVPALAQKMVTAIRACRAVCDELKAKDRK